MEFSTQGLSRKLILFLGEAMATAIGVVKTATEHVLGIGEESIDNFTFKLFYKWSVGLFITGSVAAASNQFFGDPISCETVRRLFYFSF